MKKILLLSIFTILISGLTSYALAQKSSSKNQSFITEIAKKRDLLSRDTLYRIIDPETKNVIYILTSSVPGVGDQMEVVPAGLSGK